MPDTVHIREDDLELYNGGQLETERVLAVERHLSDCQTCRERLHQLEAVKRRELSWGTSRERGWRVTHGKGA